MADTVDTRVIRSGGRRHVVQLQNRSDGTGESAVTKVDISTLLTVDGKVPTYSTIEKIKFTIEGMSVRLNWDHTTPDEIATLVGQNVLDWRDVGGITDPRSAGGTGDITLTTIGHTAGDTYDITIYMRLKA